MNLEGRFSGQGNSNVAIGAVPAAVAWAHERAKDGACADQQCAAGVVENVSNTPCGIETFSSYKKPTTLTELLKDMLNRGDCFLLLVADLQDDMGVSSAYVRIGNSLHGGFRKVVLD